MIPAIQTEWRRPGSRIGGFLYRGRVWVNVCPGSSWGHADEVATVLEHFATGYTVLVNDMQCWLAESDRRYMGCAVVAGKFDIGTETWSFLVCGDELFGPDASGTDNIPQWRQGNIPWFVDCPADVMEKLSAWAKTRLGSKGSSS